MGNRPHNGPILIGRNAVSELLKFSPERFEELVVAESEARGGVRDELLVRAERLGIRLSFVRREKLSQLAGGDSHQGFVAFLKQRPRTELKPFLQQQADRPSSLVIMLDSIFDPHNFGAILRAAECFGADAVVYSKNRGAPVSAVVTKVSVGASEIVPLIEVSNLAQAAEKFHDEGFLVVAADGGKQSVSIEGFTWADKILIIMGSEGDGVQPLILKRADARVAIPMQGRIDSLNVSQATAVFLHEARKYLAGQAQELKVP